jgi:hypothetical protein
VLFCHDALEIQDAFDNSRTTQVELRQMFLKIVVRRTDENDVVLDQRTTGQDLHLVSEAPRELNVTSSIRNELATTVRAMSNEAEPDLDTATQRPLNVKVMGKLQEVVVQQVNCNPENDLTVFVLFNLVHVERNKKRFNKERY